jgi:GT2 family glycosyltransferase
MDRPGDLMECLESIEREAEECLSQVIVVDDAPARPARPPATVGGTNVEVVRNPRPLGAAISRNRALTLVDSKVDVIGFLDDDVRLQPGWFATAVKELDPARGAITGPVQRFDAGLVARARQLRYERRYSPLSAGAPVDFLAGGNALVWRTALEAAGGFPETSTMSDTLLAQRLRSLGTACYFVPELVVSHRNSKGLRVALREAWRAGRIDGARRPVSYLARLRGGLSEAPRASDPAAALLNVALDAVFLAGHGTSRAMLRRRGRVPLPEPQPDA